MDTKTARRIEEEWRGISDCHPKKRGKHFRSWLYDLDVVLFLLRQKESIINTINMISWHWQTNLPIVQLGLFALILLHKFVEHLFQTI